MLTKDFILNSFLILFSLNLITKVTLLILNIKHIKNNMQEVPSQFSDQIDLENHQKAQYYTIAKNKFSLVSLFLHAAILLFWLFGGGITYLYNQLDSFGLPSIWLGVLFIISFNLINALISIPEGLYSTFILEEKFGFNKTTPKLFIIDQLKGLILSLVIGIPLLYMIISFITNLDENWWFYTWIALVLFQFVIIWAYPKFIAPIFNKFTPLTNIDLAQEIDNLTKKCDVSFKDYFVMDASIRSSHGNAYFTGFGKNKRIVFFDTLISTLSINEVIAVLAHELGHFKKKHIIKSITIGIVSMFIAFFILGKLYNNPNFLMAFNAPADDGFIALLLFMLVASTYTYFFTPISAYLSRKNEFEADEFAATHASAKDLISALLTMYKDNSSSLTPHPIYSKFYFSHPPANERVQFLEKLEKTSP